MPHKHKRKQGDDTDYELPPTQRARPLPVKPTRSRVTKKNGSSHVSQQTKKNKSRKGGDDTPRAFRRIMAMAQGKKSRSGLDDGTVKPTAKPAPEEMPRIRPGEDMRSFATRVDAALPVSGLTKKSIVKDGKDEQGLKVVRTRKERKMHKLYDQWRAEERKIQERKEEELELEAERELEDESAPVSASAFQTEPDGQKGSKKSRRQRRPDVDDDPWAQLKKRRAEAKVGLHDTVQAPPELHKQMRNQLKVGDAAVDVDGIPKSAGSLRRREELQAVRDDVVEAYRKIREHEQAKLNGKR